MAQVPDDVVKEFEQALDDEADRWLQEAASEIPSVKSVRLAQVHAPKGGVSIGGKQFKGGEFIPGEVLEKATPEEKAKIEGGGDEETKKTNGKQKQTDSPQFKKWFRDSKAVDDEGEPMRVFHTTAANFDEFLPGGLDPTQSGKAIWFSGDPENTPAAHNVKSPKQSGARVIPVFLQINRPLLIDDKNMKEFAAAVFGDDDKEFPFVISDAAVARIKGAGHDGIIFEVGKVFGQEGHAPTEFIVFEPTQIKSAIGNRGTFDPASPDIRMSVRMAQVHAPKGGVSIGGKKFKGGEFIPGEDLAKATPEERAAVEGGEAKAEPKQKGAKPSQRERNAVVDYTTDKFQQINAALRGQQEATPSEASMIKDIDSFLDKAPKRTGATVRSFQIPADSPLREMLQVGGVFSDAAYLSTRTKPSLVDEIAFRDRTAPPNRVVLRVEGQGGVDISGLSLNPGEAEVLYPRGSQFEVVQAVHLDNGAILAVIKQVGSAATSRGASAPSNPDIRMSVA